jgi:predicted nucleic acid-binding protein
MMVVDTNIVVYMFFETQFSPSVVSLHQKDSGWQAPVLWQSEFLNVISLYIRKNYIDYEQALENIDTATKFIEKEHPLLPFETLEFIFNSNCSSYDCEFVALAHRLETKLITYDKQILKEFPTIAIKP